MPNLIVFDKNRENLKFNGPSKLAVNFLSNHLIIEPENEEFKMISASFKCNYVMKKNLLFVFAEFDFLDFCLVFKNEHMCKKIFEATINFEKYNTNPIKSVNESFIIPIIQTISNNPALNFDLIEIIAKWIDSMEEEDKKTYLNMMKEFGIYVMISSAVPVQEEQRGEKINFITNRKRNFIQINNEKRQAENPNRISKKNSKAYSEIIPSTQFQLMCVPKSRHRKLIIFTSDEKESFHEFRSNPKNGIFECVICGDKKTVIIDFSEANEICAKMIRRKHSCPTSTAIPKDYKKIIQQHVPISQLISDEQAVCLKTYCEQLQAKLDAQETELESVKFKAANQESQIAVLSSRSLRSEEEEDLRRGLEKANDEIGNLMDEFSALSSQKTSIELEMEVLRQKISNKKKIRDETFEGIMLNTAISLGVKTEMRALKAISDMADAELDNSSSLEKDADPYALFFRLPPSFSPKAELEPRSKFRPISGTNFTWKLKMVALIVLRLQSKYPEVINECEAQSGAEHLWHSAMFVRRLFDQNSGLVFEHGHKTFEASKTYLSGGRQRLKIGVLLNNHSMWPSSSAPHSKPQLPPKKKRIVVVDGGDLDES